MAGRPKTRAKREAAAVAVAAGQAAAGQQPASMAVAPKSAGGQLAALTAMIEASHVWLERLREHVEKVTHPHPIFAREVRKWGGVGAQIDLIARLIGMGEEAITAYYGRDYDVGAAELFAHVSANMYRIATSTEDDRSAVKAATEILNRRGGEQWRAPAQKLEVSRGEPKGNLIDSSKLTFEERAALRAIIERAVGRGNGVAGVIEGEG